MFYLKWTCRIGQGLGVEVLMDKLYTRMHSNAYLHKKFEMSVNIPNFTTEIELINNEINILLSKFA